MRSLAAHGVGQARPVLYLDPADRVRVVARPRLRRDGEHPWVKPPAAAAAALEKDVGKSRRNALEDVVHAEDLAVVDLSLLRGVGVGR